jgi:hypothetical protein
LREIEFAVIVRMREIDLRENGTPLRRHGRDKQRYGRECEANPFHG